MTKLFDYSVNHRLADHSLKVVLLMMLFFQNSCDLVKMGSDPETYPDKVQYDFVLEVRELGTEQPIGGAWVLGFFSEVDKLSPRIIQQFSGNTNDSGLYHLKGRYYQISHMQISGAQHMSRNSGATNGQRNIVYLKPAASLRLRFDFANLASKEPDGLFDMVKFTIGGHRGEVSSNTTTGSVMLEGDQNVVVGLAGYKNGRLVQSWQNWVYLPSKQNVVHAVTLGHDEVAD